MARASRVCSFCGKGQHEVLAAWINGPGVAICDECVEVQRHAHKRPSFVEDVVGVPEMIPYPRELKEATDEYVIGQDSAKRILAVAVQSL